MGNFASKMTRISLRPTNRGIIDFGELYYVEQTDLKKKLVKSMTIFWPGGQKWPFLDFFYSKVDFTFWDLQRGITITRDQVWMIRSTFWKSFDPTQPPKKIQLVLGTFVIIKFFKVFSPIWAVLIRYQIWLQKWLCIHMFWHQNQSE